jgi:hypothetical protein
LALRLQSIATHGRIVGKEGALAEAIMVCCWRAAEELF